MTAKGRTVVLLVAFAAVGAVLVGYGLVGEQGETSEAIAASLGSGFIGSVISFFVFDMLIRLRDERHARLENLRRDVLSGIAQVRNSALRELMANDWLDDIDLRGADLSGASLRGASLKGANLIQANLFGANLEDAHLDGAQLYAANLQGVLAVRASFRKADLEAADLRGSMLIDADFTDATVATADFDGANLTDARRVAPA